MQIEADSSTFGNFKWTASAEVSQDQLVILAKAGVLQIMQRSPASNAEKTLAGYEKRPENFKRSSIAYSDETARRFEELMSGEQNIGTKDNPSMITVSVVASEWEIGAGAEPAYKLEKQAIQKHIDAGDFAQWMKSKVGFEATVADKDSDEVLKAVKAYADKVKATL